MLRIFYRDVCAASGVSSFGTNIKWLLLSHTLHMVLLIRLGQSLHRIPGIGKLFSHLLQYFIRVVYGSDISLQAKIGEGFVVMHGHDIVIGADVKIGSFCKIFNGVTLGNKDTKKSSKGNQPSIGNRVVISTGAKVLGPIVVGDDCVIGANSVVVKNVPSGAVVAGVPAKIIRTGYSQRS